VYAVPLTPEEALAGAIRHAARARMLTGDARTGQHADIAMWDIAAPPS
jgi:imidazolonepropionase-like amidohydrolase